MKYFSNRMLTVIYFSVAGLFSGLVVVCCASEAGNSSISKLPTCESVAPKMAVELALELANSNQTEAYPTRTPSEWENAIRAELREKPIVENLQEGEIICTFAFYNGRDPIGNAYVCVDKTGKWIRVNSDGFQPIDCITALRRYDPNI